MDNLEKLFSDPIEHQKMLENLANEVALEQIKDEMYEYFSQRICAETGNSDVVSAWKTYKKEHL